MLSTKAKEQLIAAVHSWIPDTLAVYVFGSAASGNMNAESDIDVAILRRPGTDLDVESVFQLKTDLAVLFKRDIDLVDMLTADDVTRAQVITSGELVMCTDTTYCAAFETSALAKYADLNEARREILEDIKRRGSIYGG